MKLGLVFPNTEIEPTATAIRDLAQGAEALGYDHLLGYDHVVGADPAQHQDWAGPYTHEHRFHEPLILFAFLSGLCSLDFATSVLVAPQRQTALVAKQAAELDLLSDGRLRLGVGIGWNAVEYEALGMDFHTRAMRLEGQIALLRALWHGDVVDDVLAAERVRAATINPAPRQGSIPIWIGSGTTSRQALLRVGRLADGWMPATARGVEAAWEIVRQEAARSGRPAGIGLQGTVRSGDSERLASRVRRWAALGATHLAVDTTGSGGVGGHLGAAETAYEVVSEHLL